MSSLLQILGLPPAPGRISMTMAGASPGPRAGEAAGPAGEGTAKASVPSAGDASAKPKPPRTEAQIQQDLQGGWDVLNDINDKGGTLVDDFLKQHPDHPAAKKIQQRRAKRTVRPPDGRQVPDADVQPPLTDNQKRGLRPRRVTGVVEEELAAIANARGPQAAEAAKLLEGQRAARGHLADANRELQASRRSPGGGAGGTGGADGRTGDSSASTANKFQAEAEAFKERATKIEGSASAIESDARGLEKKAEVARKQLRERQLDPEKYFARMKALEDERLALVARRKTLVAQAEAMKLEAKTTVERMAKAMPKEMAETFGKQTPEQLIAKGRSVKPGVTASGLFNVFTAVMTGYDVVKSVQYVLAADNFMDGVERAVEVGGSFAAGAIEGEILAYLAGSAAGGIGLAIVLQMPSDQGGDSERLEREAREKAQQEQAKKMARRERMMIGRYLEKTSPGSVEVVEDAVHVRDQKLWDKTVKEFHQLQATQNAKQYATLRQRAYELGKSDGRARSEMTHKDDIEGWKEVKNAYDAMTLAMDLFTDYRQGYEAGNARIRALEDKATRLAYADAKAGKARDPKQVGNLPDVGKAFAGGAHPMTLIPDLLQTYADAYDAYMEQHRR